MLCLPACLHNRHGVNAKRKLAEADWIACVGTQECRAVANAQKRYVKITHGTDDGKINYIKGEH